MPASKRLPTSVVLMLFALIAAVGWAGPASAAADPTPTVSVSDRTPAAGSTITFCGSGFQPGESVLFILVDLELGARVNASGDFCKTFPLVRDHGIIVAPGPISLGVMGETSGRHASLEIVIGPAVVPPAAGGELAFTGTAAIGTAALGGLSLVVGALMVFAGRRRKSPLP